MLLLELIHVSTNYHLSREVMSKRVTKREREREALRVTKRERERSATLLESKPNFSISYMDVEAKIFLNFF